MLDRFNYVVFTPRYDVGWNFFAANLSLSVIVIVLFFYYPAFPIGVFLFIQLLMFYYRFIELGFSRELGKIKNTQPKLKTVIGTIDLSERDFMVIENINFLGSKFSNYALRIVRVPERRVWYQFLKKRKYTLKMGDPHTDLSYLAHLLTENLQITLLDFGSEYKYISRRERPLIGPMVKEDNILDTSTN